MEKNRLDVMMEDKKLAHSRSEAQRIIMAGDVRVNGVVVLKPGVKISRDAIIELDRKPQFVSRGGEKLLAALKAFDRTDLHDWICVDVGASTGGFTDCLLQHSASKVYAVDVGYGVLDWKIRNNPRVAMMERTNARYVECFADSINLVTVDASFISLNILLPVIHRWFTSGIGEVIVLIKPQFEAGRKDAAKGAGVIRDPLIHQKVIRDVLQFAEKEGFSILGLIRSPLTGPKGNVEFLGHLSLDNAHKKHIETLIDTLFPAEDPGGSLLTEPSPKMK